MANSRFLHEEIYRGKNLTARLNPPITVCGAGAIGSNLVDNLTRQGFSKLTVIDMDRVEIHNLNTQIYAEADVGALKVDALKNRIFRNIGVEIETVNKEMTAANVKQILKKVSIVVDCFDNNKARQLVQDFAREKHVTCVHVGLNADFAEVIHDDFYRVPKDQTEGDVCDYPLARNIAMLSVIVATEELLSLLLDNPPRLKNWSITLKDLKIQEMFFEKRK
jgi:tRNA A37 threonylcarbamoyladenosine dehydratase